MTATITLTQPTGPIPAGARIVRVVQVHYDGWAPKWDEWIQFPSYRIAPAGTHVMPWMGGSQNRNDDLDVDPQTCTIHGLHRRLESLSDEERFFNPVKPTLFGVPLLLYVLPKKMTNAKLYELVWEKTRRYAALPRSNAAGGGAGGAANGGPASFADLLAAAAGSSPSGTAAGTTSGAPPSTPVKAKSDHPPATPPASVSKVVLQEVSSTPGPAASASAGVESKQSLLAPPSVQLMMRPSLIRQISADGKEIVFPPFVLKRVNRAGTACSECSWIKMCQGCTIDFTNEPISKLGDNSFLAIDWNPLFFSTYFKQREMNEIWDDEHTVTVHRQISNRPISFADCMATFTTPEVLDGDSRPRCPNCKQPEKATKGLELWNTPPILVIHLKRLLPGRKLYTLVDCPLRGFDPSPFVSIR